MPAMRCVCHVKNFTEENWAYLEDVFTAGSWVGALDWKRTLLWRIMLEIEIQSNYQMLTMRRFKLTY